MELEERAKLVVQGTVEVVTHEELRHLLEEKRRPSAYWGFECSGLMHIGMGLVCGAKIREMLQAGFDFTIFLADWHSWINNKLGGDLGAIRKAGEYYRHCFTALGIDPERVRYSWSSELTGRSEYWQKVIEVAKRASLRRAHRALPIMGREMELSEIETAWLIYPCMQVADIFELNVDVACAGIDQRKAHMLARDVAEGMGFRKPICVHTPLLMALGKPEAPRRFDEDEAISAQISAKMSKSVPKHCIFVHDEPDEIRQKLKLAFCPPRQAQGNPVLDLAKQVIFRWRDELLIKRETTYGGPVVFSNYEELERAYVKGTLHPLDLKLGVAEALIEILEPVRSYFRGREDLISEIREIEIRVTR